MNSFEELQSKENKNNIKRLGALVKDIKNSIPKDKEKVYGNFNQRYEDIVTLKEHTLS